MATEFGNWLLQKLAEKDWTQAQLAKRARISRQALYNYINQPRENPDKDMLTAIARALDIPPETVFRAAGLLPQLPSLEDAQAEILRYKLAELSSAERDQVIEYIDFIHQRKRQPPPDPQPPQKQRQGSLPGETVK